MSYILKHIFEKYMEITCCGGGLSGEGEIIWAIRRMIELLPVEGHKKILHCTRSV